MIEPLPAARLCELSFAPYRCECVAISIWCTASFLQRARPRTFIVIHPAPSKPGSLKPLLSTQRQYESFLDQLSVKERAHVVKCNERREAESMEGQVELWKRLAGWMAKLAPYATKTQGAHA